MQKQDGSHWNTSSILQKKNEQDMAKPRELSILKPTWVIQFWRPISCRLEAIPIRWFFLSHAPRNPRFQIPAAWPACACDEIQSNTRQGTPEMTSLTISRASPVDPSSPKAPKLQNSDASSSRFCDVGGPWGETKKGSAAQRRKKLHGRIRNSPGGSARDWSTRRGD